MSHFFRWIMRIINFWNFYFRHSHSRCDVSCTILRSSNSHPHHLCSSSMIVIDTKKTRKIEFYDLSFTARTLYHTHKKNISNSSQMIFSDKFSFLLTLSRSLSSRMCFKEILLINCIIIISYFSIDKTT